MRGILSSIILIVFLTPIVVKVAIYASFKINQAYIAAELCENKEKPEMKCNGHCYLAKEMKKSENKSSENERPLEIQHVRSVIVCMYQSKVRIPIISSLDAEKVLNFTSLDKVSSPHILDIFHPPQLSS